MMKGVLRAIAAILAVMLSGTLLSAPTAQAAPTLPEGLVLPFARGLTNFTSGPHTWNGTAAGNRGSVDFGSPNGEEQRVYAAAGGRAHVYNNRGWKRCYVVVQHGDGWGTAYYHLKNVPRDLNGKTVRAGDLVGDMGAIGIDTCGGGTYGYRHVHFVLLYHGSEYPIDGLSLGGHTIRATSGAYCGRWTNDQTNAVAAESVTMSPPSASWPSGRCPRMEPGLTNNQTTPTIPIVTASPLGGTYRTSTITLSSSDPNASIYYTKNGAKPTNKSKKYSARIPMASMTLKYIAVSPSGATSVVGSQKYVLRRK